jgi:hypothetical protein
MDANRFDRLSRAVGDQMDRRGMFKAAAGGALGLLGLSVLDGDVSAKGFDGDRCKKNKNCGTGLECRGSKKKRKDNKGKCRYRDGCGDKGDACQNNDDCCGSRKCRDKECRGKKN